LSAASSGRPNEVLECIDEGANTEFKNVVRLFCSNFQQAYLGLFSFKDSFLFCVIEFQFEMVSSFGIGFRFTCLPNAEWIHGADCRCFKWPH
jgi:hypothetical protein